MTNSTTPQATTHTTDHSSAFDVELAQLTRNDLVEATYRGRLVVLSPKGEVALSLGDARKPFFLRSGAQATAGHRIYEGGRTPARFPGRHRLRFAPRHLEQMRAVQDVLTQAAPKPTRSPRQTWRSSPCSLPISRHARQ